MKSYPHQSHFFAPAIAALASLPLLLPALRGADSPVAVLRIDAGAASAHVSPVHYGLMTEEINHSYDGGLYGELIRNRSLRQDPEDPVHWSILPSPAGGASKVRPVTVSNRAMYLRLNSIRVSSGIAGIGSL